MTRRALSSDPTEAVSLELESFSVTNPSWDRPYLIREAKAAIQNGMPVSRARIIYGADVVDAASAPD
jgi:hypothetical protein